MTPERLQAICDEAWDGIRVGGHFVPEDVLELLNYIDLLHEDLRITRAERDAEKHKRAQQSKDHTAEILAWDALAEDGRAKAWDEGYEVGCNDCWHDDYKGTKNPYRKDTK